MTNNESFSNKAACKSVALPWKCLKPGDVVDIIAPAAKCHPNVIEKVRALLESWGLKCNVPIDLFGDDLLFSNTNEKRFSQLECALLNKESKAIWCLLGGYGSTKLIPMLNKIESPLQQKIFIGFSDITALHIFLQGKWGWSTIHAPSARQAAINKVSPKSIEILKQMLFNDDKTISYKQITPLNDLAKFNKIINAPIIGGNLHLIQTSLATNWQIDTTNKILLIEEINERAYRIDRVLEHLNQAKIFEKAKAILFGDLIGGEESDGKSLLQETVKNFADQCLIPVLQINNVGHGAINNPIILGSNSTLTMGNLYSLTF